MICGFELLAAATIEGLVSADTPVGGGHCSLEKGSFLGSVVQRPNLGSSSLPGGGFISRIGRAAAEPGKLIAPWRRFYFKDRSWSGRTLPPKIGQRPVLLRQHKKGDAMVLEARGPWFWG